MVQWPRGRGGIGIDLSVGQRFSICAQIADAVAALHALGLAHGDIHCGNIVLREASPAEEVQMNRRITDQSRFRTQDHESEYTERDSARSTRFWATLVDFGLSQRFSDPPPDVWFNPHAPPERFSGPSKARRTESTDVYALGCTVYTILTQLPIEPPRSSEFEPLASLLSRSAQSIGGETRPLPGVPTPTANDVNSAWNDWIDARLARSWTGKEGSVAKPLVRACMSRRRPTAAYVGDLCWCAARQ